MADFIESAVAYLKTTLTTSPDLSKSVAGIIELEEAQGATRLETPYAYIFMLGEQSAPNESISVISQRVTVTFAVVIAVANTTNPLHMKGAGDANPLAAVRNPVLNAMLDWQFDTGYDPVTYKGGRLVLVKNRVLWWQDEFESAYYLRK